MKKQKTAAQYEKHLNELYSDMFSEEQALDNFIYMTVKGRQGGHVSERTIRNKFARRELGSLQRKYDSIAFYTGFNEWK